GIALLDASLDLAVAAPGLLACVRARARRAVRRPVVAALAGIHRAVAAELALLVRSRAIGRDRQILAGLGRTRDHAVRQRRAAPDLGPAEAAASPGNHARALVRLRRRAEAGRRDDAEAGGGAVDRSLAADRLSQDLSDDLRPLLADG